MTILQLSGDVMRLEHRADMLRGLAACWDETIFRFDRDHDRDCPLERAMGKDWCLNLIIDALTAQACEYADVLIPRAEIRSYMEDLRDAVNALTRYETGHGWDGDEDPEKHYYSDDAVLGFLNADIDFALWPLLSGKSQQCVCFRCTRSPNAARWNSRVAGKPCCEAHS